jgi:hypothetical protein
VHWNCIRRRLNESRERNETTRCLAKQQAHGVSNVTGRLIKYSLGGAYVRNWVKLQQRESDHKPLKNAEITSGVIILSLYMSVLCI